MGAGAAGGGRPGLLLQLEHIDSGHANRGHGAPPPPRLLSRTYTQENCRGETSSAISFYVPSYNLQNFNLIVFSLKQFSFHIKAIKTC